MLNGYSGYAPASFYEMRELMNGFPDDRSIAFLRRRRVDYVVIRTGLYELTDAATLLERVRQREELSLEVMWTDGTGWRRSVVQCGSVSFSEREPSRRAATARKRS